jgi:hypothetical protein
LHPLCLGQCQRSQQTNYFKNQKHSLESSQLVFGVIYDTDTAAGANDDTAAAAATAATNTAAEATDNTSAATDNTAATTDISAT